MVKTILFFHLIFAILWIGGMIYTLFFLRPSLNLVNQEKGKELIKEINRRFFPSVFISIIGLLLTGLLLIKLYRPDLLKNGLFHFKLATFLIMTLNFFYIYFWLHRKEMFNKIPVFVGINLILGILVVFVITYIR